MADKVVHKPIDDLRPYGRNNRIHTAKSIAKLKASIAQFGFVVPILADAGGAIIAGHGRWEAAKANGLKTVPVVVADHLSEAEVRALRIADNKLAELSDWNEEALRLEFSDLLELGLEGELDFDLTITGFETPEIDLVIGGAPDASASEPETVEEPDPEAPTVTRSGDLWILGSHRLFCGNALEPASYDIVLDGEDARLVFTDPPYNVPVNGHVRSGNAGKHREFAMASGEMTDGEFRGFLKAFIDRAKAKLLDGGIAMICMDWRHVEELISSGRSCGLELINLCVWNKTNGGMGSLYRSKHELVCVFRKPGAQHVNNVELGKHGRNRTNVWDYAGVNSFGKGRSADLVDHPTVKPTALVAAAIMDVTHRGDVVLDGFGGSGATLLAAEKTGRRARLIELDPAYVDVAIRRWQDLTGKDAILASSGQTFEDRSRAAGAMTESMEAGDVDA
ncbi:site-specific DNA-methyltransferase [Roseicyclus salinarum]|uniref:site-specific DNA-methyltransferase n=1 Tax=Roseicyclus salinarum TaxID=3036773 RepID=UPI0024151896|nr:DNA methyltransferase [Roseibacterium sp. SDUM158017]